jgi:hypothetical protein
MNEELEVLNLVTQKLNKAEINYMISGSIAVNYYSIPRMTRDIDIVVELEKSNTDKFIKIFENDFYLDKEVIKEETSSKGMFNLIHKEYFVKVDFIVRKESKFKITEFSRKKKISIKDFSMWIVSPEDLILVKLDWAKESYSEIQLKDVQNLITSVKDLDWAYINKWIQILNLNEIYNQLKI